MKGKRNRFSGSENMVLTKGKFWILDGNKEKSYSATRKFKFWETSYLYTVKGTVRKGKELQNLSEWKLSAQGKRMMSGDEKGDRVRRNLKESRTLDMPAHRIIIIVLCLFQLNIKLQSHGVGEEESLEEERASRK